MLGIVRGTLTRRLVTVIGSVCFAAPCLLLLTGCPVDERTLHLADVEAGGSGSGGSGDAGAQVAEGGEGGGVTPPPDIHCVYVEGEALPPECNTLIDNAGFAEDIATWQPENKVIAVDWNARDATNAEASGSMAVTNALSGLVDGTSMQGAFQCLPATPSATYDIGVDVFIPKGQFENGKAGVNILFFGEPNCMGMSNDSFISPLVKQVDEWVTISGTHITSPEAVSMSVRLIPVKPFREQQLEALFDNILVKVR